jgi:phosphoribosylformimino-5-aminoimidazole carboxamide ribotide isomerase
MAFPEFEVVPAVDLEDGEVVQLIGGERDTGTRYGDPVAAAREWVAAGARTLHVVDLDGAFEGERVNADAIDVVLDAADADVQLGGGIRTAADARALLDAGVDRVILGTAAVENPELVDALADEYPDGVMVSLDASDGEVVVSGWTEGTGLDPADAAARYEELGAAAILFTDVDVEGQQAGVRADVVERVVAAVEVPVVASGGVAAVEDVVALRDAGAAAVVVGTALYEGAFTLGEAVAAAEPVEGRVFAREDDEAFVLVAEGGATGASGGGDAGETLTLWRYDDTGFVAVDERPREWLAERLREGWWRPVRNLPEHVLEQVSGEETPSEWVG